MSKAFTKEDGAGEPPLRRAAPGSSGARRYITREGLAQLQKELEQLEAERLELVGAGAGGSSPRRQEIEQRQAFIRATLEAVTPVEPTSATDDRVFFGAWVELEDEEGGRSLYRLVGPDEAEPREGRISVESPLGRALLGREVGDTVVVDRPRGKLELSIEAVRYAQD